MNQLTFHAGSFAGETIRTTEDGYASIYDVMKIAGVGRDAPTTWSELKSKLPQPGVTTGVTSDPLNPRPLVKSFKFPGRGQRDTPVVSGQGLVRLLFLLPGKRARQFVAESAETLVRHIGGDETLVEEIRRNRALAVKDPNSAQAFMAVNVTNSTTSSIESPTSTLALEERRAQLVRFEEETKALKLDVLQKYATYALSYISDPRVKEHVQNEVVNQVLSGINPQLSQRQIRSTESSQLESSTLVTVDQVVTEMGLRMTTKQKSAIGKEVAEKYRREHPGAAGARVEKYVNGEMRDVRAYPRSFEDSIKSSIMSLVN